MKNYYYPNDELIYTVARLIFDDIVKLRSLTYFFRGSRLTARSFQLFTLVLHKSAVYCSSHYLYCECPKSNGSDLANRHGVGSSVR